MKPDIEVKRFDEWEECDCNECEQWWTSRCDGSKVGKAKECKSYIATRRIDIPQQLDELEHRIKDLEWRFKWIHVLDWVCLVLTVIIIMLEVI